MSFAFFPSWIGAAAAVPAVPPVISNPRTFTQTVNTTGDHSVTWTDTGGSATGNVLLRGFLRVNSAPFVTTASITYGGQAMAIVRWEYANGGTNPCAFVAYLKDGPVGGNPDLVVQPGNGWGDAVIELVDVDAFGDPAIGAVGSTLIDGTSTASITTQLLATSSASTIVMVAGAVLGATEPYTVTGGDWTETTDANSGGTGTNEVSAVMASEVSPGEGETSLATATGDTATDDWAACIVELLPVAGAQTGGGSGGGGGETGAPGGSGPALTEPSGLTTIDVTDDDGLDAAIANRQPGQKIRLGNGTYSRARTIGNVHASAADPIVIEALNPHLAVIAARWTITSSHHWILRLKFDGGQIHIRQGGDHATVGRCIFDNSDKRAVYLDRYVERCRIAYNRFDLRESYSSGGKPSDQRQVIAHDGRPQISGTGVKAGRLHIHNNWFRSLTATAGVAVPQGHVIYLSFDRYGGSNWHGSTIEYNLFDGCERAYGIEYKQGGLIIRNNKFLGPTAITARTDRNMLNGRQIADLVTGGGITSEGNIYEDVGNTRLMGGNPSAGAQCSSNADVARGSTKIDYFAGDSSAGANGYPPCTAWKDHHGDGPRRVGFMWGAADSDAINNEFLGHKNSGQIDTATYSGQHSGTVIDTDTQGVAEFARFELTSTEVGPDA